MNYLMHHYLKRCSELFPDKEALVQDDLRFSYKELDDISNRLACLLSDSGCNRMDRVGVFLEHSLNQIFSFYGILKADSVYVPINSLLLGRQANHIAKDCRIKGLIVDTNRLEKLKRYIKSWDFLKFLIITGSPPDWVADLHIEILSFDKIFLKKDRLQISINNKCIGSDLAALLYTSGSTGKPKGVMISHDNLIAGAKIVTDYLGNRHEDRLLGVLPVSFDAGLNQVTCSVLLGMTYVMKSFRFPGELVKVLLQEKITGFAGIPTIWLLLLQKGSSVYKNEFKHLRYITNTGGTMPSHAIESLKQVFDKTDIVLMYGLTEAFRSTYLPPDQLDSKMSSMGKAIPGVEILVVNKQGKICQPNEVGELVHRGPTVSLGYWNNPEKTNKVFRPNHFLPSKIENSEKLVYSGDLVKMDEDGYLYFVARDDHMIKCYGHRISPAEIEETLYSSGKIKLCAAVGLPDPVRGQRIKVYVTPQHGEKIDEQDILTICAESLPTFMIPRDVEFLEEMPRTSTGKIDLALLKNKDSIEK